MLTYAFWMRNKTTFTNLYWHKFVTNNCHFGLHGFCAWSSCISDILCACINAKGNVTQQFMRRERCLMSILYTNCKELQRSNENLHWSPKVWAAIRDSTHFAAPWFYFPTLLWPSAASSHARSQWWPLSATKDLFYLPV